MASSTTYKADPDERRDLSEERPEVVDLMHAWLARVVDLESRERLPQDNELRLDPEMDELLNALGYTEGSGEDSD